LPNIRGPEVQKPMTDLETMRLKDPAGVRKMLGDGNFGGYYQRSDDEMLALWHIAVEETRALMEGPWA
jgi:creatinine amidohydrolase